MARLNENRISKVDLTNLQGKLWKLYDDKDNEYGSSCEDSYRYLVNFSSTENIPIHRWFHYKEGFSPYLVNKMIDQTGCNNSSLIFDPCSGVSTTLLSAKEHGVKSIGFEINPLSIFIGKTKLENYTRRDFKEIENFQVSKHKPFKSNVYTKYKLSYIEKLFDRQSLEEIETIKNSISKVRNKRARNLLFLCLLSILEPLSNYRKSGNGLKRKSKATIITDSVSETFGKKLAQIKSDVEINSTHCKETKVIEDSCLNLGKYTIKNIDMTLFSPPYPNCFDPFEIYKIELWLGEFVKSYNDLKVKRRLSIASNLNTQLTRNYNNCIHHTQILSYILPYLLRRNSWNKRIARMLNSYFFDIYNLLHLIYSRTRKKGYCIIVIGNSAYGNIPIATDLIIGEIGKKIGFKVDRILIARKNETSSQQYNILGNLTNYIRESVMIFRK